MLMFVNIVYFISVIIVPIIAIVAGYLMKNRPPDKINNTIGYRTRRSKASQEAWDFANRYCGKNTLIFGIICLIVSVIAGYVLFFRGNTVTGGMVRMLIIMLIQIVLLVIVMALPTEMQLKKRFE